MKNVKRLLACLLTVVMLLGAFAGCAPAEEEPKTDETQAAANTEAPAAEEKAEPVVLEWYIGAPPQEKQDDVFAAINEILVEELNVKVNFHLIDYADYGQQMQILLASGDPIDMMWTSNWTNDFYTDASKGAYQPIDLEMVKEYGPAIMNAVPEGAWDAARIKGELLAIPNVQVLCRWPSLFVQNKFAEKYNFDLAGVKTLNDITPLLEQIAANEKDMYAIEAYKGLSILTFYVTNMGLEYFGDSNPLGIRFTDEDPEILNIYETPEMKDFLYTLRDWYNKGIIRPDAASVTDVSAERSAGKLACVFNVNNPDTQINLARQMGLDRTDLTAVPLSDPYMSGSSIVATMNAINVNSQHAKECIQVLNKFYDPEDTRCINLLNFGIEGVNYKKVADDLIEPDYESGYFVNCAWAYGDAFNCMRYNPEQPAWRPMGPDLNDRAIVSPIMGFSFDPEPVKAQLAQIAAVMAEYVPALQTGSVDVDSTLEEFLQKLDQAGVKELQAEMQKQLDEWKANQ